MAGAPDESALVKFPRTQHIFDAGGSAVTRDDLLLSEADAQRLFLNGQAVLVEEKVDGANLGLSLAADGRILAQNRSHFVNSASHEQFKSLDTWIDQHRGELYDLLSGADEPAAEAEAAGNDDAAEPVAGGYILYGEWLFATHSIRYTALPDYFLAFDLYCRRTGRFLSRAERDRRLAATSIASVPLIDERPLDSKDALLALLETKSQFCDEHVEGVYLRVEETLEDGRSYLKTRAKLVHPDFIQNITKHWMAKRMTRNTIAY